MELNFELNLQNATKWNIPTDRAHRLYDKNEVIYLVIMFTPRVIIIKMSKMVHFFVFLAEDSKKIISLGKITKCSWEILLSYFRKRYGW